MGTAVAISPIKDDIEVVERVLPTIVQIGTAAGNTNVNTVGTGIIVGSEGYILTAKHNVSNSQHVFVRLIDKKVYQATYYLADAHKDLALIKVAASGLPAAKLGDSNIVRAGQEILVFGFPSPRTIKGNETVASVSRGIISARDRELQEPTPSLEGAKGSKSNNGQMEWGVFRGLSIALEGIPPQVNIRHLLQIDAMMNPGSSGGAVTDLDGRVVGICHSIISNTGGNVGINFAIAINEANTLLQAAGIQIQVVGTQIGGQTNGNTESGITTETPK